MNSLEITEGNVTVLVNKPTKKNRDDAHLVYVAAWRKAVENKAILREKLNDYLIEQGVWDDKRQREYETVLKAINDKELILKKGGIPLKKAKTIAFELKRLREDFRDLISTRTNYDQYTAEGVADNARFDYFVTVCVVDAITKQPVFKDLEDYNERGAEPWAVKAASQLASFLYDLDPNYEKNLVENKFLINNKFVDENGRLINKEGHLIAIGADGRERLINDKGEYILYDENGQAYNVNYDGTRPEEIVELPFLNDDEDSNNRLKENFQEFEKIDDSTKDNQT